MRIDIQDHPAVHPVEERDQRGELDEADPARPDPTREDLHHQVERGFFLDVPGCSFVNHFLFRNMANMGVNVVVDVSMISIETPKYV